MEKTFTYVKPTGSYYLESTDEIEEDGEDFDYTVDDDDLLDAIVDIVYYDYFRENKDLAGRCDYSSTVRQGLKKFIIDNDNLEQLVDDYEDRLWEAFKEEALENHG